MTTSQDLSRINMEEMVPSISDKLFFPVQGVTFDDLVDWSDQTQLGQVKNGMVKKELKRQSSQTGALVDLNEAKLALFRHENNVYAISEKCPHAGGPLHVGDIEMLPDKSLCVRCPWHSWRFDLKTGKAKRPLGRNLYAKVFPTRVKKDGQIYVGFDEFDKKYFLGEELF